MEKVKYNKNFPCSFEVKAIDLVQFMSVFKPILLYGLATLFSTGCSKQELKQGDTFGIPLPGYSLSDFAKFPSCQCKVLEKYVDFPGISSGQTNYHIFIVLEKNNGEQFAVTQAKVPQDVVNAIKSLEKNRSYSFPDVLTKGNQESMVH